MQTKNTFTVLLLVVSLLAGSSLQAQDFGDDIPLWKLGIATFGEPSIEASISQGADSKKEKEDVVAVGYDQPSYPIPPSLENPVDILQLPEVAEAVQNADLPIANAIAAGETAESLPLAEQTEAWYEIPWRWVTRGWENHAEFGLDGSSGNARTLALQTGFELKRSTDRYTLGVDFDYRKATTTGVTTEDNGRFDINYDFLFQNTQWTAFSKFGSEWDQFKAFDSRINLNGGVGYDFIRTDDALFITRFGAGASKEIGAPDDDWKPEAVFGAEGEYQLNRYNKMKAKVEYFPVWSDFSDYRVVTDAAWEILLDDSDNLSLKLAVTDRYDSTPQGARPNDIYYSLLLLVKF
ncbi:MAG: DUF481 domain-containing protein [Planctomycetota bacterium]